MTTKRDYFVHERAVCDTEQVGSGTRIWGFTHILSQARIGRNCNICEQVFIENKVSIGDNCTIKSGVSLWDYVTLEDGVFVGPSVVFTNDKRPRAFLKRGDSLFLRTLIERGASLGANSTIVCGTTIGRYALVGAGCTVTADVPPHTLVVGNPARAIARVCYCGETLKPDDSCPTCLLTLAENSEENTIRRLGALQTPLPAPPS